MKLINLSLASLAFFLAAQAQAQTLSYGISAGGALPQASLKDYNNNAIPMVGAFMDIDFGKGHVVRPRIDFMGTFEKKDTMQYVFGNQTGYAEFKRTVPGVSLGADYAYYINGKHDGFYATAGLGIYSFRAHTTWPGYEDKQSSTNIGGSLGVGYDLDAHWGVQVKYFATKFKSKAPFRTFEKDDAAAGICGTVYYRF